MVDLIVIDRKDADAPEPVSAMPDPSRLLEGDYNTRTWNFDATEDNRLFTGIWESTPGKVTVSYDEWEFCHIISGKAILTNEEGQEWHFKKGDAFVIPAGFKGTWETVKKLRKHYVILNPKAA